MYCSFTFEIHLSSLLLSICPCLHFTTCSIFFLSGTYPNSSISQSFQTPHPQTSQRLQSLSCWDKGLWINNIKTLGENKGPCRMPCQLHNIRNQLARWHHNTIGNIRKLEVPGNIQWKENVIMMSLSSLALQEVVILKPSVQPAMRMSSNGDIFILCMKVLEYWDSGVGSMYWLVHGSSQYVEKLWKMLTYFHVS